jgi:hypothetical protein
MHSKSLQYTNIANSKFEMLATAQPSFVAVLIRKISDALTRSEIERAQASYEMKRTHKTQAELHQDIVGTLPVEEKLRLGMYHFMQ